MYPKLHFTTIPTFGCQVVVNLDCTFGLKTHVFSIVAVRNCLRQLPESRSWCLGWLILGAVYLEAKNIWVKPNSPPLGACSLARHGLDVLHVPTFG